MLLYHGTDVIEITVPHDETRVLRPQSFQRVFVRAPGERGYRP